MEALRIREKGNYDIVFGGFVPEEAVQLDVAEIVLAGGNDFVGDFWEVFCELEISGPATAGPKLFGGFISD